MGKREPEVRYRTIDGGHPAPYPDMTDEQLYNYEVTFNVPRRTFDRPPAPVTPRGEEVTIRREPRMVERPVPQEAAPMAPSFSPPPSPASASTPVSGRSFDAPRYTARPARETPADQAEQPTRSSATSATSASSAAASGSAAVQAHPAHPDLQPTQIPPTRMPPPLDFSRPVRLITTKQPVEIITTRARHPVYKVHGYIGDDDVVTVFTHDGRLSENGLRYLENVPQQHQLYVNVYANTDPLSRDRYLLTQHESREHADAAAQPGRLACIAVELDG